MFDFPGIYSEADDISNRTQRNYLLVLKIFLGLLVLSSVCFSYCSLIWEVKLANAIISLGILSLTFIFSFVNFQGIWYNARAVAESIKTICWRYACKAEPYNIDDDLAKTMLLETMKDIIDMNHDFKKHITARFSSNDHIPDNMTSVRSLPLIERIDYYYANRVVDQRNWYEKKSNYNNKRSVLFFVLMISISMLLSVFLFLDLDKANTTQYPIEILLSFMSIIFTWVQTKKYRELDKSYALAAYEIGFIAYQKSKIDSEDKFSNYIINSENAFSREHTQWLARKDS